MIFFERVMAATADTRHGGGLAAEESEKITQTVIWKVAKHFTNLIFLKFAILFFLILALFDLQSSRYALF